MISIKPSKLRDFAPLMQIEIPSEQQGYIQPFDQLFNQRSAETDFFTIYKQKVPVGFFVIDKSFSNYCTFAARKELNIKNLVLAKEYQGQGIAGVALRKLFVSAYSTYHGFESICSTVLKSTPEVISFFKHIGFEETNIVYRGELGAEAVLRYQL